MKSATQDIDLSILTDEARKELLDFYLFLVNRYGVKKDKKGNKFKRLISNPIKVNNIIIPSRENLYER